MELNWNFQKGGEVLRKIPSVGEEELYIAYKLLMFSFKEDSAGFAEVFLECSLEIAVARNSSRSNPVASNTMKNLFSKMEPPEPEKFPWEQCSLTIKAEEELDVEIMYVLLKYMQLYILY